MEKKDFIRKDEIYEKEGDLKAFWHLLQFAKNFKKQFFFSFLLLVFSSIFFVISARLMGDFVQEGLIKKSGKMASIYGGLVLFLEVSGIFLLWRGRCFLARAASQSILCVRKALFRHIHALPVSYYDHQPQGRTVTRMTQDVENLEEFFTSSLGRLIACFLVIFVSFVGMLVTDYQMGLLVILSMAPMLFITYFSKNRIRVLNRVMQKRNSAVNARLNEYVSGMSVIHVMGLEGFSQEKYNEKVDHHLKSCLSANSFYTFLRPLVSLFCSFPFIVLIWFAGRKIFSGNLEIGIFVAFIRYAEASTNRIFFLMREIHIVQQAFTASERIYSFLKADTEERTLGADGKLKIENASASIRFENVSMGYQNNAPILKNVSFEARLGEKIGLAGHTGSGKSTTISLLARLYDYQKGEIYLNNYPLKEYSRNDLRKKIGLVTQEVVLFSGSIRENLALGESFSDETIMKSCQETGLLEVMKKNRYTLDSSLLEKGENLSVGERQLLALTRVFLRDPAILILDEATANIDGHYEKMVQNALQKMMKDRTCLIIAHRLQTLAFCDRIIVFNEGKIIEQGIQQDLINLKGHFFHLYTQNQFA